MFCKQISKIVCPLINKYQTKSLYVDGMFVDDALEAVGLADQLLRLTTDPENTQKIYFKNAVIPYTVTGMYLGLVLTIL